MADRTCAWCDFDISGTGEADPIMYARSGPASRNWQCADALACQARQDQLDAEAGVRPIPGSYRAPVAAILRTDDTEGE